jgi:hypothetical protein
MQRKLGDLGHEQGGLQGEEWTGELAARAATKAEDRQKLEIRNPKSETNSNFVNFPMGETGEPDKPQKRAGNSQKMRRSRRTLWTIAVESSQSRIRVFEH